MTATVDVVPADFPVKAPRARCWECPLYEGGEMVPSDGPKETKLVIVGEAPGRNEAKMGRPFIGESGQLLNATLRHYKMNRREILLTNACLCRDPSGATPSAAAIQACRPRLMHELAESGAPDIVALGNSAAQSILNTRVGITALRIGQGRENKEELPGVRVIPSFHPAACLRQATYFPSMITDFGKLKGFSATWYEPKWKVFDDETSTLAALAEVDKLAGPVVMDIESDIEKDVSFETPLRHTLLCIGLSYAPGKVIVIGENALQFESVKAALRKYLTGHRLIGQNLKFDNKGLWAHLGVALKVWFDTMLADYCLSEYGQHDLEYMAVERLGAPSWKGVLDKYKQPGKGYGSIPRAILYRYNALDVHATGMVATILMKALRAGGTPDPTSLRRADGELWGLRDLHDFLCRASDQLMFVELNGIAIDKEYNAELARRYTTTLKELRDGIVESIPNDEWHGFNPNSHIQVKKVLKSVFGFNLPMKMNTKREYAETSDAETLTKFLERSLGKPAERFLRLMLKHRGEAKLFGTYVKGLRKRMWRGRVYPTFLLHRTSSGRLSSRNPNSQNIPRGSKMRKQFVPAILGNVFVEGDFAQAEGRVMCWLAQDEFLREIFNDPTRDLFDELTPRLYGNTAGISDAARTELRIRVKAYFYGLGYGREAYSIALEYAIPVQEAERGMREFFKVIPATVKWREETRMKVLDGKDLITPFGRHHRVFLITKQNRKDILNEALSFLPQSIASDICLDAMCHIRPRLKGIGYIRNIVHDSILAECAPDKVALVKQIMNEEMLASARRIVGDYVAFKVDFKTGPSWGELTKPKLEEVA